MQLIGSRLRTIGGVPGPGTGLRTVVELILDFEAPEEPRKIRRTFLLDVDKLRELGAAAQTRRSRPYSSSTVAAAIKDGRSVENIVRRWLDRR